MKKQEILDSWENINNHELSTLRPKFRWKYKSFLISIGLMLLFSIGPATIMGTMSKGEFERMVGIRGGGEEIMMVIFALAGICYLMQPILYYVIAAQAMPFLRQFEDWEQRIKRSRIFYSILLISFLLLLMLVIVLISSNNLRREFLGGNYQDLYLFAMLILTGALMLVKIGTAWVLFRKIDKQL